MITNLSLLHGTYRLGQGAGAADTHRQCTTNHVTCTEPEVRLAPGAGASLTEAQERAFLERGKGLTCVLKSKGRVTEDKQGHVRGGGETTEA